MLYLSLFVGKIPVALNLLMMLISERPLYHTSEKQINKCTVVKPSLGPNRFILSFNSSVQALFNCQKHENSKGSILFITWGGSFKTAITSSLAFSINDIDMCNKYADDKLLIVVSQWIDCKIFQTIDQTLTYSTISRYSVQCVW